MKLATTTLDFYMHCDSIVKSIEYIYEAGFKYIDLSFDAIDNKKEKLFDDDWQMYVDKIMEQVDRLGMKIVQSHAVSGCNMHFPGADADVIRHRVKRCIEVCGMLGISNTVLHCQMSRDFNKEDFYKANYDFLKELFPVAEKHGVTILMENGPKKHLLETYYTDEYIENPKYIYGFAGAELMKEFIDYVHHPLVHACWDTGHANMEGMQYPELKLLGNEVQALHVHDNKGLDDEHTIPYTGTMNLDDLMHGLIDIGYDGYFTFEACNIFKEPGYWLGPRRIYADDKRLERPSLDMQRSAEKLLYDTGVYILSKYNVFEE